MFLLTCGAFSLESQFITILGQSAEQQLIGVKDNQMCTGSTIGNVGRGFLRAGKRQWMDLDNLESGGGEESSFEPTLLGRLYKGRLCHQNEYPLQASVLYAMSGQR